MTDTTYFLDTYAIVKFNSGDPAYKEYEKVNGILTIFNLAELNWVYKRENKPEADQLVQRYSSIRVPVEISDIKSAMDLRMKNKNLSIPDVIGYTIAKRHGVKFLTGDKEFQYMENVEFVK